MHLLFQKIEFAQSKISYREARVRTSIHDTLSIMSVAIFEEAASLSRVKRIIHIHNEKTSAALSCAHGIREPGLLVNNNVVCVTKTVKVSSLLQKDNVIRFGKLCHCQKIKNLPQKMIREWIEHLSDPENRTFEFTRYTPAFRDQGSRRQ